MRRKAEWYAADPHRTRKLVEDALRKADRRKGRLREVWDSLMALTRLVRAYANGSYRKIPWKSLVLAVAALLYFVMPFDIVPDWIVGMGFVDDAAVIVWVVRSIKSDLDAFVAWEQARPAPDDDAPPPA